MDSDYRQPQRSSAQPGYTPRSPQQPVQRAVPASQNPQPQTVISPDRGVQGAQQNTPQPQPAAAQTTNQQQPPQNMYHQDIPRDFPPPNVDPVSASQRKQHHKLLIIPLIILVVLLLGAGGFGAWAFMERQEYKQNADELAQAAADEAVAEALKEKEAEFIQREKRPLKEYNGPSAFGSVSISYPKTWSAHVIESDRSNRPIEGYFHPDFVPDTGGDTAFALKLEVVDEAYDRALSKYDSDSERGTVNVSAISVDEVPDVTGARINGEIERGKTGTVVLFPLRDKTLRISTESQEYIKDFNNIILRNLSFVP
ncbi:MAG: hypothetical protein U5K77_00555 [Candidatus Saccharibacteria bacterium]|nr:hypothetical protein [Candidatus Saccharibacteria bacterium]